MMGGELVGVLSAEAATMVGSVLLEAIALYVGYGAVTRVAGPTVMNTLASE